MEHDLIPQPVNAQDYAVLRQSGTQASRACAQLGLTDVQAARMERQLRRRVAAGIGDDQLPKFARHGDHVRAVMAQGGFWALSERRVGGDGLVVCLPLVPPTNT